MRRLIIRIVVVLPHPEGPTSTQISPASTSRLNSCTAMVPLAYRLVTLSRRIMPVMTLASPLDAAGQQCRPLVVVGLDQSQHRPHLVVVARTRHPHGERDR